jgi:hypothetical protein
MQDNIKNLVKTIAGKKNTANSVFNQANTEQEFMTLLSQKSYYENYSLLYYSAIFFALVSQLATAVSSYTFFADLLAIKVSPTLLPFAVAILLLLIEVLKYVSFNKGLEGVFALPQRINYVLLVFAILLSAGSMYASIIGGGSFGIDTQRIASTETKFDAEIANIRQDIADIKARNTWKNQTWLPKKEKALLYAKEQELSKIKLEKENGLQTVAQDNEIAATQYKFGFAFFDALFLLCTLYVWYFRKNVAVEGMVNENVSLAPITQAPITQPVMQPVTQPVMQPVTQPVSNSRSKHSVVLPTIGNYHSKGRSNPRRVYKTIRNMPNIPTTKGNIAPKPTKRHHVRDAKNFIKKITDNRKQRHSEAHSKGSVEQNEIQLQPEIIDNFAKKPTLNLDGNRICEYCKTPFIYKNFKRHYYCSKACCDKASIDRREEKEKLAGRHSAIAALQQAEQQPKSRIQYTLFEKDI